MEDAADLCTACDYLTAEEHYQNGELNTAKKLFEALPKDYSYKNGAKVGVRLERLEKFKSFAALCGTWKVTDNLSSQRTFTTGAAVGATGTTTVFSPIKVSRSDA